MMVVSNQVKNHVGNKLTVLANKVSSARTMMEVGGTAEAIIKTRTQLGKDVSGAPFAPYSTKEIYVSIANRPPGYPSPAGGKPTRRGKSVRYPGGYKEYHESSGRGSVVTLSMSSQMLNDIQKTAQPGRVTLFYGGTLSAAKAHGHHMGTNALPKREHFDISQGPVEIGQLGKTLSDLMVEYIAEAGLN